MWKQTVLAAGLVIAGMFGGVPAAEAKTNIYIGIGLPYAPGYGANCFGHGYRYCRPGYRPHYYRPYPVYRAPRPIYDRLSCRQVRHILRDRGWYRLSSRDCNGRVYAFSGWQNGRPYVIRVSSRTGAVVARYRR
jgi:hypothetical protein